MHLIAQRIKKRWPVWALLGALATMLLLFSRSEQRPPIRIGVLHSLTGTMAASEGPLVDAARLAVEEINAQGGLLGRPVELVVADGKSDDTVFASEAERLIAQEKVSALFACWTSSCRKAVKPVVERHQHMMFYPIQYEGLEQSPYLYYTGPVPNQQIMPGTRWAMDTLGKRAYLLGSDYIYPRVAHRIIRDVMAENGGQIAKERFLPLGATDFSAVITELRNFKPDVVFNNLNGDSNLYFFRALHKAGLDTLPVVSFSLAEDDAQAIGASAFHPRHFAVWDYFQSLPGVANQRFVAAFKARFGEQRVTSAPVVASYVGIKLWAQAVAKARTEEPASVRNFVLRQSLEGPAGIVTFDPPSQHLLKSVRIGQARADGQFVVMWEYGDLLQPERYPGYRTRHEWETLVDQAMGRP